MNVLLVARSFLAGGGASSRLTSIVEFLSREHKVYVLTIAPEKETQEGRAGKNVRILNCPTEPKLTIIPFLSIINIFLVFFSLNKLFKKLSIDVVLASIPEFEEGVATALAAKGRGVRMVIDVGDLIVDDHVAGVYAMFPELFQRIIRRVLRTLLVKAINSFDIAVTVTPTLRRALLEEGIHVPISVITNGADTNLFRPVSLEAKLQIRKELRLDGDFLILYAGAMGVEYYPMEVIFDAFKIVLKSFPNAKLILCGSWNKHMEQLSAHLETHIRYLGFLKLQEMARVMQGCDLGVITMDERPSTFVALGTKFFEYISTGLPVVAACPKEGELDQLITSQRVGYAVGSWDYKSMAEKIVQILRNKSERQVLERNGIELVTTRFDRTKLAETFQSLLLQNRN